MTEHKQLEKKEIKGVRERLERSQRGQCPLCGKVLKDPVLDHDHDTGAIRATLCRNCNRIEGKVNFWVKTAGPSLAQKVAFLRRLAKYWLKHSENKHGLLHPSHGKPKKRKRRKRK